MRITVERNYQQLINMWRKILEKFRCENQEQYFATIIVNLIVLSSGCLSGQLSNEIIFKSSLVAKEKLISKIRMFECSGLMSPLTAKLTSENTPLSHGPLTVEQISWIGAISCLGSIIGTLSFGYLTSWIGSKRVLSFLCYPQLVSWLLIYFGTTYYHILISRFIEGWGMGGLQVALLLYISEIANDKYVFDD